MSALGTGVAAGVAQSVGQAERLGRKAEAAEAHRTAAVRSQRHLFANQLSRAGRAPFDDQETGDHPSLGYENLYGQSDQSPHHGEQSEGGDEAGEEQGYVDPDQLHLYTPQGPQPPPMIHHLDVEG